MTLDKAQKDRETKAIAYELGLPAAFILQEIKSLCESTDDDVPRLIAGDGHFWVRLTYSEIAYHYPMLGKINTIKRLIKKLEDDGFLLSATPFDGNTKCYRVNQDLVSTLLAGSKN